jgi:hypothetical protein
VAGSGARMLEPQVIHYRRERWVTPEGEPIVAPLPPEVTGQLAPLRFALPSASAPGSCVMS